jgi:hypothetical protein
MTFAALARLARGLADCEARETVIAWHHKDFVEIESSVEQ